jgi:hypothetical protein
MVHIKRSFLMILMSLCAGNISAQITTVDLSASPTWKMAASAANAIVPGTADNGATVSVAAYAPGTVWITGTVPGTVFSTYVDNGKYTNPYIDRNVATQLFEKGQDLAKDAITKGHGWWFRTNFTVSETATDRRIWLHFKGINYRAQIYVNGQRMNNQDGANESRGAFKHFYFDITAVAVRGTASGNALAVLILPNTQVDDWHQVTALDHTSNGGVLSGDGPTFICSDGWDWIPTIPDRNVGVYDQVLLESRGPVRVKYPFVNPTVSADVASASVAVSAQLENNSAASVSGTLTATLSSGQTVSSAVTVAAGAKQIVKLAAMTIPNVKLWWPNGYGAQDLYDCNIKFEETGKVSDAADIRFGCRKLSYTNTASGYLVIWVNDTRIMCRGGNWGMDEAMKRWDPNHLEMKIRWHHALHTNMIRNWVGQTDRELFYDLCDKYGILIWDDFWCPHPVDGPDPTDQAHFVRHAVEKIKRCRNHPCMALYCGKNEGDRNGIMNADLKGAIDTCNPGLRYIKWSTDAAGGVHGNGPYGWRKPDAIFTGSQGDQIYGFTSEIGMTSVWVDRTARRSISQSNLSPVCDGAGTITNAYWGWHDFCNGSAMQGGAFCRDLINNWGFTNPGGDQFAYNKEFCKFAQNQNYDGYRGMFESYNSKMNDGSGSATSGCVIWMTNPSWPSTVFQSYEYWGDVNATGWGMAKASEPVHIQTSFNTNYLLDVINNTRQALNNYNASCEVWSTTGVKVATVQNATMNFPANSKTNTGLTIANTGAATNVYFMNCLLKDASGKVVSKNVYARAKGNDWNQMTVVKGMSKIAAGTELTATAWTHVKSESTHSLSATITNTTANKIAHMIRFTLLKRGVAESGSGATYVDPRVMPTYFNDNYISLMPGETFPLTFEYNDKDAGTTPDNVDLEIAGFTVTEGVIAVASVGNIQPSIFENAVQHISVGYVPSRGIMITAGKASDLSVAVFDMLGKQVAVGRVSGTDKVYVGSQSMTRGLYIVKLTDAVTAKTLVRKVVVR